MNAMDILAKARKINPAAVTKALAEHTARVQSGEWNHADSMQIRNNRLRAIAARVGAFNA